MTDAATARPKAYSYVRFSTPEQAKGDSLRRQIEQARKWAAQNDVDLDEELTFHDLGVSAYKGRNAEVGALAGFLKAVREGLIPPGSFLIVESLDRISRQTVRKAARTMEDIVEAGVQLVDLEDGGTVYTEESLDDPTGFLIMAVRLMRGNAESKMKAWRLAQAYSDKRMLAASEGKPLTRMVPAWLHCTGKRTVLIPERAAVVREIFEKADQGWGQHRIAQALNARGLTPWGKGRRQAAHWHRSYVKKILTNVAVVGTYMPHTRAGKKQRTALDPIVGYWPAAVDQDLFDRVSARTSATAPRGRNASAEIKSMFAGVLKCIHCGGTTVRVSKGRWVYLVCSRANAKANGCKYRAVRYADVEEAITINAHAIIENAPRGKTTEEVERDIGHLDDRLSDLSDRRRDLVDELLTTKSEAVRQELQTTEAEFDAARARLAELRARRDTLGDAFVVRRLTRLKEVLTATPLNAAEANKALKEAVSHIIVAPEEGALMIHWRHSEAVERVPFYSRHLDFG